MGGIAEQAIGRSAPWFIFAIMLFSYAVRADYVESGLATCKVIVTSLPPARVAAVAVNGALLS